MGAARPWPTPRWTLFLCLLLLVLVALWPDSSSTVAAHEHEHAHAHAAAGGAHHQQRQQLSARQPGGHASQAPPSYLDAYGKYSAVADRLAQLLEAEEPLSAQDVERLALAFRCAVACVARGALRAAAVRRSCVGCVRATHSGACGGRRTPAAHTVCHPGPVAGAPAALRAQTRQRPRRRQRRLCCTAWASATCCRTTARAPRVCWTSARSSRPAPRLWPARCGTPVPSCAVVCVCV
jgi:hypothetical protein